MHKENAAEFGFLPGAAPGKNVQALQEALDQTGTVRVTVPGIYDLDATVLIGSDTALECGAGVYFRRTGSFCHLLLNKGARSRSYDRGIRVSGLKLICGGKDVHYTAEIPGLCSHISFFYVKDLIIRDFECLDLGKKGFCIQICTFENILLENLHIEGGKDGVHLGRGRKFAIRHGIFRTYDDPIALNAYDYSNSNPQFGWIEDGVIEDCYDLDQPATTGFFCRLLSGAWREWFAGMKVRNSDLVAHGGRLYSVKGEPDFTEYTSQTPPEHTDGIAVHDGIPWRFVQDDATPRSASVRNVHFKDIFLQKRRELAFCLLLEFNQYARSVYPGAEAPATDNITLENICVQTEVEWLLESNTPCGTLRLLNSRLPARVFRLSEPREKQPDRRQTRILVSGCDFPASGGTLLASSRSRRASLTVTASLPESDSAAFEVSETVALKGCDLPAVRTSAETIERV